MKRLLKNSIYFFIISAVIIVGFYEYNGSPPDAPTEQPLNEILVGGLGTQERLNNLMKFWNGSQDKFEVVLSYEEDDNFFPIILTLRADIYFHFDIETDTSTPGKRQQVIKDLEDAKNFANATAGEIAIVLARLNPTDIWVSIYNIIGDVPTGAVEGYHINEELLEMLKDEKNREQWSEYSEIALNGRMIYPNVPFRGESLIPNK